MEVISQTAQTFMPPYFAPANDYIDRKRKSNPKYDPSKDGAVQLWLEAAFSVGTHLLKYGFVMASVVASLVALVPAYYGGMLTSDPTVRNAVKPLAKYLWAGAFLTAPVAVSEGVLLARRELKFLATVYLLSTLLLPPALLRVKILGGNVEQVWACFAVFQLFRAACFAGKIWARPVWKGLSELLGGNPAKPQQPVPR
jgi:Na+-driven multidrug efflux pump